MRESGQKSGVRVLVADDDPVSLRFLELALAELGCEVCAVTDGDGALRAAMAADARFDLMILDRLMPGRGGAALLLALRARGVAMPAIATSADLDEATRSELAAAGYTVALAKPLRVEDLAPHVARLARRTNRSVREQAAAVTQPVGGERAVAPLLDDATALAAIGGDAATLKALRSLLADDLAALLSRTSRLEANLAEVLHRLRAACRYCGASALERSALAIETATRDGGAPPQDAWAAFVACCERTRDALAQDASSA